MIKTNTKKARQNIRAYILANYEPDGYDYAPKSADGFESVAQFILYTCGIEKGLISRGASRSTARGVDYGTFADWSQGLPSILDCGFHYSRMAGRDVARILEQTEAEAKAYSENQSENLLDWLIYRELMKGVMACAGKDWWNHA